jgi:hypothetical protein
MDSFVKFQFPIVQHLSDSDMENKRKALASAGQNKWVV